MTWTVLGNHPTGANISVNNLSCYAAIETEAELINLGYTDVQIVGG